MMYTKILALLVQTYLVSKASSPPSKNIPIKEVLSKEGFFGLIIARLVPKLTILFVALQSLLYIYVMIQQEIGSVPILNYKFPDWNSLEVILFVLAIGGISLRLWCFKTLEEFFTFNVTVKKDHKLVTTGPYSLLVHPSYTGGTLMVLNLVFLWYQLTCVPTSFPFGRFGTFVRAFSWFNIATLTIFLGLVYRRVPYEEKVLRKHFDKEWDSYFSQRKRFIPFII